MNGLLSVKNLSVKKIKKIHKPIDKSEIICYNIRVEGR